MVYSSVGLSGVEYSACCVVGAAMRIHLFGGIVADSAWDGA